MARMRLSAVTSCLAERGAEEAIRVIARQGYAGVEFLVSATLMPQDAPPARRQAIRALCADLGVTVVGTNGVLPASGYRFLVDDEVERRRSIDQMKRVIDMCVEIGGTIVTVGSTGARNAPDGMPPDVWFPRAVEAYREWGAYADPLGARVTVEIVNRFEANWGRTIAEGMAFLEAAGHPNLGLTIDTFHMNIDEGPLAPAIRHGGAKILHVHTGDNNRQAPGVGHMQFEPILAALRDIGYAGFLSLELFNPSRGIYLNPPAEEALRVGRVTIEQALSAVYAAGA